MIDLIRHLSRSRLPQEDARSCRAEDDLLIITTKQGKEIRFDTKSLLLSLDRLDAMIAVPVLVDLLTVYDVSGLQTSRSLWKNFCAPASALAMFRFNSNRQYFYAYSAKTLALRRKLKKDVTVVKQSNGSVLTKLPPTQRVQHVLLGVLKRMIGSHAQEN